MISLSFSKDPCFCVGSMQHPFFQTNLPRTWLSPPTNWLKRRFRHDPRPSEDQGPLIEESNMLASNSVQSQRACGLPPTTCRATSFLHKPLLSHPIQGERQALDLVSWHHLDLLTLIARNANRA